MIPYDAVLGLLSLAVWAACALTMIAQLSIPRVSRKTGERVVIIRNIFINSKCVGEALFVIFVLVVFSPIIYVIWWVT